jgi:hypothetical protein
MSRIHYFQRYSQRENAVTNNTLLLFSRVYADSPLRFQALLAKLLDDDRIPVGVMFEQQKRTVASVPDGFIEQRAFRIVVETKVNASVQDEQLFNHLTALEQDQPHQYLLLVTVKPQTPQARERYAGVLAARASRVRLITTTFEAICQSLEGLYLEHVAEMKLVLDDYARYCEEERLIPRTPHTLRIVPCGTSFEFNVRHAIYFHPSDRGHGPFEYLGLYRDKSVQYLLRPASVFDVKLEAGVLNKDLVVGEKTDRFDLRICSIIEELEGTYEIQRGHRFFCADQLIATDYKKESPGGIQGPRNHHLADIPGLDLSTTETIAAGLRTVVWN